MSLMTLNELVAQASIAISRVTLDQQSGRISEIPSARTVRYYTTCGLVDKPAQFKGRTALYARRHLLQLVSIKRLQSLGLELDQILVRLAGASDDELEAIAKLPEPDARQGSQVHSPTPPPSQAAPRQANFWQQEPASPPALDAPASSTLEPSILQALKLHPQLSLMIEDARRPIDPEDLDAISAAAAPLIALLHARHLI